MIPAPKVGRVLSGVLILQLVIGAALVVGDLRGGALALPTFAPNAPRLTQPVRPGDQRRVFRPDRDRPSTQPLRQTGPLPERLALTEEDGIWRLEGTIAAGDADRIIDQMNASGTIPNEIVLQSPGGSVQDALTLGRAFRDYEINTHILSGEICYSACPYLFAGGAKRSAETGASLGVHQHYFGESTLLPAFAAVEDIQRGQGEVMAYLIDMEIDPAVMQHGLTTPADEIYILLPEQLERYRLVSPKE